MYYVHAWTFVGDMGHQWNGNQKRIGGTRHRLVAIRRSACWPSPTRSAEPHDKLDIIFV